MKRIDDMDKAKSNAHNMIKFNDEIKDSLQRQLSEFTSRACYESI